LVRDKVFIFYLPSFYFVLLGMLLNVQFSGMHTTVSPMSALNSWTVCFFF